MLNIESLETQNETEVVKEKNTRKFGVVSVLITTFIIIMLALFIQFQIRYETYFVEGVSMQPTLNEQGADKNDFVYVNKLAKLKKGDIVVLNYNKNNVQHIIKRVIATAGDTVNISGIGKAETEGDSKTPSKYSSYGVFVNGELLAEEYLKDDNPKLMEREYLSFFEYKKNLPNFGGQDYKEIEKKAITVSENCIFILGDNRKNSEDSSSFGEVNLKDKVGRVDFIVKYGTSNWSHFFKKLSYLFVFKF